MYWILTLATLLFSGLTHTQERLPSLPGLGALAVAENTGVADPTFPDQLEDRGELYNAALEWQRLAHSSIGAERALALFRLGRVYQRLEEHQLALRTFEQFGLEFAQSPLIPEALYWMSRSAAATDEAAAYELAQRAVQLFPQDEWTQALTYRLAWDAALAGQMLPAGAGEQLAELRDFMHQQGNGKLRAWFAGGLSVVPGLGHLSLGDWRTALTALLINGLFLWALVYALHQRHWPYAAVFGLVVAILWSGTIFSAHSLALREAREARLLALAQASELHPKIPLSEF